MQYQSYRDAKKDQENRIEGLEFIWLEITNRCNLHCLHCYSNSDIYQPSIGSMNFDGWCNVMKDARALGCRSVQFIGGEPTMHPNFAELVDAAASFGFSHIEVYTNGTTLTDKMCKLLSRYNASLAISLYSSIALQHDEITNTNNSFEKTTRGIKKAIDNNISLRLGVIDMGSDVDLGGTVEYLRSIGVENIKIDKKRLIGRAANQVEEINKYHELCGSCGVKRIAVNSHGEISPCVFSHFHSLGNVTDGIPKALSGIEYTSFLKNAKVQETKLNVMGCTPRCGPNECSPGYDPSPACSPNSCDPDMCNPISCAPRD